MEEIIELDRININREFLVKKLDKLKEEIKDKDKILEEREVEFQKIKLKVKSQKEKIKLLTSNIEKEFTNAAIM